MSAVAAKTAYTPDDLLAMPDGKDYELVDGRLVERNVSALSSWIGGELLFRLRSFLQDRPVGLTFGADNGYQCFPGGSVKVCKPDVSFIKLGRLPADWQSQGYLRVAPDLAVEVASPNDFASDIEKILEYLKAGVALVWVINAEIRVVRVHRADFTSAYLTVNDELSGEDALPGFSCRVEALFPPTAAVSPEVSGR